MTLCTTCSGIPTNFFDPVPADFFSPTDCQFRYPHLTPSWLRLSASNGCPMCKILAYQLHDEHLSKKVKDRHRLTMKRAIIDPQQGFGLWMGNDDLSHNFFLQVPSNYEKALPRAQVDEGDDGDVLMNHWVKDCMANHEKCEKNGRPYCPTRVLDLVTYQSSGDILLAEPVGADQISYTALSHCWGPPSCGPMTTTTATLPNRRDSIAFDDLPLTFKDAVTITRKLGIPYLWIDSLCIIQDSAADWAKEAGKMAQVYAGAVCTLSALGSSNSRGGFFRETKKKTDFGFRYDLNLGNKRIRVFACAPNGWGLDGPLMERAWTLQERKLSTSILYFSRDDLLWECKSMRASADIPFLPYKAFDSDAAPELLYDNASETVNQSSGSYDLRSSWFSEVEGYSCRNLTYGKDKLIALSGLAHYSAERDRKPNYAAGLWEEDLPSALLWRTWQYPPDMRQTVNGPTLRPPTRPEEYRAPSWSWASVDAHISYDSQRVEVETRHGGIWLEDRDYHDAETAEYDFGAFKVNYMQTTTSPLDPMGAVSDGRLILTGVVAVAHTHPRDTSLISPSGWDSTCTWLRGKEGSIVGALLADVQSEVVSGMKVFCVSVRREREGSLIDMPDDLAKLKLGRVANHPDDDGLVMGLALIRSHPDVHDGYGRLGIVRWVKGSLFMGKEARTIIVV